MTQSDFEFDLYLLQSVSPSTDRPDSIGIQSLLIAFTIFGVWASSLFLLMCLDVSKLHLVWIVLAMLGQMFLYTGLFITAHDAMHGVVFPRNLKVNNFVGAIALRLYGLFSYKKLLRKHWQHHHHPASHLDPDFHDGEHKNFFAWYFHFMKGYWSWWPLFGLIAIYHSVHLILHIPEANLVLFWIIPSISSSVQLFYFGTFNPHKEPIDGYNNPYRAQTNPLPIFWSFITCYHFGYHKEHHEFPQVPWWQLPAVHKLQSRSLSASN